jgi:hypothetical protein
MQLTTISEMEGLPADGGRRRARFVMLANRSMARACYQSGAGVARGCKVPCLGLQMRSQATSKPSTSHLHATSMRQAGGIRSCTTRISLVFSSYSPRVLPLFPRGGDLGGTLGVSDAPLIDLDHSGSTGIRWNSQSSTWTPAKGFVCGLSVAETRLWHEANALLS